MTRCLTCEATNVCTSALILDTSHHKTSLTALACGYIHFFRDFSSWLFLFCFFSPFRDIFCTKGNICWCHKLVVMHCLRFQEKCLRQVSMSAGNMEVSLPPRILASGVGTNNPRLLGTIPFFAQTIHLEMARGCLIFLKSKAMKPILIGYLCTNMNERDSHWLCAWNDIPLGRGSFQLLHWALVVFLFWRCSTFLRHTLGGIRGG